MNNLEKAINEEADVRLRLDLARSEKDAAAYQYGFIDNEDNYLKFMEAKRRVQAIENELATAEARVTAQKFIAKYKTHQ